MSAATTARYEPRVREMTPRFHAFVAEYAELVAGMDENREWRGAGMRDCADWLVVHCAFSRYMAESLVLAGRAMRELPQVGEAFSAGEVSLDQVRSVSTVATAENQGDWVETARTRSAPQLARACREAYAAERIDAPSRAHAQRARRGLRFSWDELGMLRLSGALPPDEGTLVRAVVESFEHRLATERSAGAVEPDPAEDPPAALRADALFDACCAASGGLDLGACPKPSPVLMTVHVDVDVLTGEKTNGRCHIENGPAISTRLARRLACDAAVVTLTERDGSPIDAGRQRQIVSIPMRRGTQSRDRGCVYPGCPVRAENTQPHHIWHWVDLGPTRMWNLVSLCTWHHGRHHHDEFEIRRTAEGDLVFEGPDGRVLGMATGGHWKRPRPRVRAGPE